MVITCRRERDGGKFTGAEDQPSETPRYGGEHFDRNQNTPGLREPKPQPGQNVRQSAREDHMAEQPAVVRPHRLRRAYPDFLDGFYAGPAVEKNGERRNEADEQHGRDVAEAEPEQEQRRVGEARNRSADADERQADILSTARAPHQHANGYADERGQNKAAQ